MSAAHANGGTDTDDGTCDGKHLPDADGGADGGGVDSGSSPGPLAGCPTCLYPALTSEQPQQL